jgi:hypothetical protein
MLPIHVAAWIKELKTTHAVPTVKLRMVEIPAPEGIADLIGKTDRRASVN